MWERFWWSYESYERGNSKNFKERPRPTERMNEYSRQNWENLLLAMWCAPIEIQPRQKSNSYEYKTNRPRWFFENMNEEELKEHAKYCIKKIWESQPGSEEEWKWVAEFEVTKKYLENLQNNYSWRYESYEQDYDDWWQVYYDDGYDHEYENENRYYERKHRYKWKRYNNFEYSNLPRFINVSIIWWEYTHRYAKIRWLDPSKWNLKKEKTTYLESRWTVSLKRWREVWTDLYFENDWKVSRPDLNLIYRQDWLILLELDWSVRWIHIDNIRPWKTYKIDFKDWNKLFVKFH